MLGCLIMIVLVILVGLLMMWMCRFLVASMLCYYVFRLGLLLIQSMTGLVFAFVVGVGVVLLGLCVVCVSVCSSSLNGFLRILCSTAIGVCSLGVVDL